MSSKGRKGRKKSKTINDVSKDGATSKKIHSYFTNEEIAEIKTIMRTKDVTGIPFVIAATVLYKPDLLKKLLEDGYCLNQTGQNNMTALMWAVKYKYLDLVDFLLSKNAIPTIKTESGDNVLILALEHKLWDEQSVISLYKKVKKDIDVNLTNKNGHNMLHMCVRRDWEEFLRILLLEKPDVDAANFNGVTPLMLACFRDNINIVEILIEAGADVFSEDNHGRMTLCYAISSAMKVTKPPLLVTGRIVAEMEKKCFLETYLKKRVELIISTARKIDISYTTSEMLIKIVQFVVQYIDKGIQIFLDCEVFKQIYEVLEPRLDQAGTVKFLLEVCEQILFYNQESKEYDCKLHQKLGEDFYESGLAFVCLEVMNQSDLTRISLNLLLLAFNEDEKWKKLLQENNNFWLLLLTDYQNITQDEKRVKILTEKKQKMKRIFDNMNTSSPSAEKGNNVGQSKKSRKRSKTIKAKLTKIKSTEFTKRVNLSKKKLPPPKAPKIQNDDETENLDFFLEPEETFKAKNPIVTSLQHLLEPEVKAENTGKKIEMDESWPEWKKQIMAMSKPPNFKNFPVNQERLSQAIDHLRSCPSNQRYDPTINRSLNIIIDYLKQLMQLIVRKYREHWDNDKTTGYCTCNDLTEHVPWLYSRHLKILEAKEKEIVQDLQKNFDHLIKSIKDLAHKDLPQAVKAINKLESTILNYEIRGTKTFAYISETETITMNYTSRKMEPNQIVDHVQNVLNNLEQPKSDLEIEIIDTLDDVLFVEAYKSETPLELFCKETQMVKNPPPTRNRRKEIEAKMNTIANRFHLINSIMSICDEEDDQHHQIKYGVSDLRLENHNDQRNLQRTSENVSKKLKCPSKAKSLHKLL